MNWHLWWQILVLLGGRYFLIAGAAFIAFYLLFRSRASSRRIQAKFPQSADYRREIGYSILTLFIFAAVPTFIFSNPFLRAHTTVYTDIFCVRTPRFTPTFRFMECCIFSPRFH